MNTISPQEKLPAALRLRQKLEALDALNLKNQSQGGIADVVADLPSVSAVGQNQPVMVGIKGFKTSHFVKRETCPSNCAKAVGMGHVQRPQSEPSNNDIQFARPRVVWAPHCARVEDRSGDGGPLKVSRTFQHRFGNRLVPRPMIRLSGKWLEEAGFPVGGSVEVKVHSGEMRLTVHNRLEQ